MKDRLRKFIRFFWNVFRFLIGGVLVTVAAAISIISFDEGRETYQNVWFWSAVLVFLVATYTALTGRGVPKLRNRGGALLIMALSLYVIVETEGLATYPIVWALSASLVFIVATFTALTGVGIGGLEHRGGALIIMALSFYAFVESSVLIEEQSERQLAELRETDPQAYLAKLKTIDERRWRIALQSLDPEAYEADVAQRRAASAAEREAQCAGHTSLAYVMIQADVRSRLLAPSTADFPGRYEAGTGYIGDCVYRVNGYFDAQNGFGAMIRGNFTGTTKYFPESDGWRTLTLDVQG